MDLTIPTAPAGVARRGREPDDDVADTVLQVENGAGHDRQGEVRGGGGSESERSAGEADGVDRSEDLLTHLG